MRLQHALDLIHDSLEAKMPNIQQRCYMHAWAGKGFQKEDGRKQHLKDSINFNFSTFNFAFCGHYSLSNIS